MLNNCFSNSLSLISSDIVGEGAAVTSPRNRLPIPAKVLLKPVFELLASGQIRAVGQQAWQRLSGLKQIINSCTTETCDEILSQNLKKIGIGLLDDPNFAGLGEALLQVVVDAKLPDWQKAKYELAVHRGTAGSVIEHIAKTFRRATHVKNVGPTVLAMAGGGLVGRGMKLATAQFLRSTALVRGGGGLIASGIVSGVGLSVEASTFPALHAGGAWFVDQPLHLENYAQQAWGSLLLVGGLRGASRAARLSRSVVHGTKLRSGIEVATRFRVFSGLTHVTLPLSFELGTLSIINRYQNPHHTGASRFGMALSSAWEFRIANGILAAVAPKLTSVSQLLERQAHQTLRETSAKFFQAGKPQTRERSFLNMMPQLAALGPKSPMSSTQAPSETQKLLTGPMLMQTSRVEVGTRLSNSGGTPRTMVNVLRKPTGGANQLRQVSMRRLAIAEMELGTHNHLQVNGKIVKEWSRILRIEEGDLQVQALGVGNAAIQHLDQFVSVALLKRSGKRRRVFLLEGALLGKMESDRSLVLWVPKFVGSHHTRSLVRIPMSSKDYQVVEVAPLSDGALLQTLEPMASIRGPKILAEAELHFGTEGSVYSRLRDEVPTMRLESIAVHSSISFARRAPGVFGSGGKATGLRRRGRN